LVDAAGMNMVWEYWIHRDHAPGRATAESKLATSETLVEIMVQALL
jgi:hypothetical protein